jgi:hypothetical protein
MDSRFGGLHIHIISTQSRPLSPQTVDMDFFLQNHYNVRLTERAEVYSFINICASHAVGIMPVPYIQRGACATAQAYALYSHPTV